jgi:hypothetical protein
MRSRVESAGSTLIDVTVPLAHTCEPAGHPVLLSTATARWRRAWRYCAALRKSWMSNAPLPGGMLIQPSVPATPTDNAPRNAAMGMDQYSKPVMRTSQVGALVV